jgi:integrase
MGLMKYVQRRANRLEFRFPLPDDIAGLPYPNPWPEAAAWIVNTKTGRFKTELIKSLSTNDRRAAERAALPLIERAHRMVDLARRAMVDGPPSELTNQLIDELIAERQRQILAADENTRAVGAGLDLLSDRDDAHDGIGMTTDDMAIYRRVITYLDDVTRDEAATMRGGEALNLAIDAAVSARGIVPHPDDPAWRKLEVGFIRAQRQAVNAIKARLDGEIINTPPPAKPGAGDTLTVAARRWAEGGGRAAKRPRENSAAEAMRAVQRFVELHGDLELSSITKAHAREYRDAIAKVPKRIPHRLAKMRLPELLKQDLKGYEPRNAQTVNKYLNLVSGILAKAEKDGYFEHLGQWSNPFRVGFDISNMERDTYEPFSVDELNTLFASPVYKKGSRPKAGQGEAAFWLPFLAIFTGARRTELLQLKVGDIRSTNGLWFIDFNDEGADQNLKNMSSARSVPIHTAIQRAGFLDYVTGRAEVVAPEMPLWPGFDPPLAPKAKAWSKWFGRYLSTYVVDDRSKTFHSFRHTFKRACREAGISEEIHHAFTGHSGGGVGRSYGRVRRSDGILDRGVSLERLKQEIDRVEYAGLTLPSKNSRS